MCIFKQENSDKVIVGRFIQFSYLEGTKKERQYSSLYVDMSKDSCKSIGVFANWFKEAIDDANGKVNFLPSDDVFTVGYLSMENYVSTIGQNVLETCSSDDSVSFSISQSVLNDICSEDWFICQPRLRELLREHRKKLSKMSKMS